MNEVNQVMRRCADATLVRKEKKKVRKMDEGGGPWAVLRSS
jgi:hypothetical protein